MVSKAYNKEGVRYADRTKYAREKYDKTRNPRYRSFRGVDGEGGNVPSDMSLFPELDTRHEYLTLRAGEHYLETGSPLKWWECLAFLADLPPYFIDVAYFFDYDVTMIIRGFPEERARRLLNRGARTSFKTGNTLPLEITAPDGTEYEVDYLPHKEFRVRRKGEKHWTVVSDVGQFFQKSYADTIDKWEIGTPEERAFIRKSKLMRADFAEVSEETRYYNTLECLTLQMLMTEFRDVCEETGYVPKKWQGPGNLASAMLTRHGVPRREDIPILKNDQFRRQAQAAYYGGRFETTCSGPVPTTVYQYDINGAYVALLRSLPCLTHGSWRRVSQRPDMGLWFGEISFDYVPGWRFLYNLPFRLKNGNINFPKEGKGVYWSTEVEAAERCGTQVVFHSGWVYEPHCDCRWFDFVDDYYSQRLALGKTNKGYVLKLAGNSIYGKIAQSIGYAPWANPVWAGLITAGCRAQLIDAYSAHPNDCLMLATDGLFMTKPLDVKISNKLGEWEETVHPNGMFIVQPGIYFLNDDVKTRGVEHVRIEGLRSEFEAAWEQFKDSNGVRHSVAVDVTNFITAKQALARNKWHIAGTWEKTTRQIGFHWGQKRAFGLARMEDGMMRTYPVMRNPLQDESTPYDRIIGGGIIVPDDERYTSPSLQEAARMAEQPDWVEPLF